MGSGFNWLGLLLCIVTVLSVTTMILFHYFVTLEYNRVYRVINSYWFSIVISIIWLIYFIVVRWSGDIKVLIDQPLSWNQWKSNDYYNYSYSISRVFLLDLCPMIGLVLPIFLIVDKTKNMAKILCPFSIIGSIITIFFVVSTDKDISSNFWKYIFIGTYPNVLIFLLHYINLLFAVFVLLTSKQFTKWSMVSMILFMLIYFGYISIFINFFGVGFNTTGLSKNDWFNSIDSSYSEYGSVYNLLPIGFPSASIFWFTLATIVAYLFIYIKNITTKDINKKYNRSKRWYSEIDYLNIILLPIEIKLDKFFDKFKLKLTKKQISN